MKRMSIVLSLVLAIVAVMLISCSGSSDGSERQVKKGDIVAVNYTGMLKDGKMFDSSLGKEPLQFKVGEGNLIEGFDSAVVGMKVGEKKTVTIPPEKAYGQYSNDLIYKLSASNFKAGAKPEVGMIVYSADQNGNQLKATVIKIDGDTITVDANHPLAGQELIFEITLEKIL